MYKTYCINPEFWGKAPFFNLTCKRNHFFSKNKTLKNFRLDATWFFLGILLFSKLEYWMQQNGLIFISLAPFYSAPSIFAVFRNLLREIWFEISGSKNLVRKIWFEKSGSANLDFFFLVREKWLTRRKNPTLQNHFSTFF